MLGSLPPRQLLNKYVYHICLNKQTKQIMSHKNSDFKVKIQKKN